MSLLKWFFYLWIGCEPGIIGKPAPGEEVTVTGALSFPYLCVTCPSLRIEGWVLLLQADHRGGESDKSDGERSMGLD